MSLPIHQAVLIQGATRLAANVASRVGQAIGFDEILRGSDSTSQGQAANPNSTLDASHSATDSSLVEGEATLIDQIADRVRRLLQSAGIDPNPVRQLTVEKGGVIRVAEEHPRSAEIESLLNADLALVGEADLLSRLNRGETTSIGLTHSRELANIQGPGGYPNW